MADPGIDFPDLRSPSSLTAPQELYTVDVACKDDTFTSEVTITGPGELYFLK